MESLFELLKMNATLSISLLGVLVFAILIIYKDVLALAIRKYLKLNNEEEIRAAVIKTHETNLKVNFQPSSEVRAQQVIDNLEFKIPKKKRFILKLWQEKN